MNLRKVRVETCVVLAQLDMNLRELARLGPGDALAIDLKTADVAAELVVQGQLLARGRIVEEDERRFFELTALGGGTRSRPVKGEIVDGISVKRNG